MPAGPSSKVLVPVGRPPPSRPSSCAIAARAILVDELDLVFGGDEARENIQAASPDREVVVAATKRDTTHLGDAQATPFGAVLVRELLEQHHAMRDALQVIVFDSAGAIIQHQHGACVAAERTASARAPGVDSATGSGR